MISQFLYLLWLKLHQNIQKQIEKLRDFESVYFCFCSHLLSSSLFLIFSKLVTGRKPVGAEKKWVVGNGGSSFKMSLELWNIWKHNINIINKVNLQRILIQNTFYNTKYICGFELYRLKLHFNANSHKHLLVFLCWRLCRHDAVIYVAVEE